MSHLGGVADAEAALRREARMRRTESDERLNRISSVLQTELQHSTALVRGLLLIVFTCFTISGYTFELLGLSHVHLLMRV